MGHIRPFQLPQDMDTLASLLQDGFKYPENPAWSVQDDEKENMQDQIKSIKSIWPLMRVLQLLVPFIRDVMRGYIYEEDGLSVGLINYGRQKNIPEWYIGNVTVLPEYRRRGIARKLVEAAVQDLQTREAEIATLEVIADNVPAYGLYEEMGFLAYRGTSDFEIEPGEGLNSLALAKGYVLKRLKPNEWQTSLDFAQRTMPEKIREYEPVKKDRFQPSSVNNLLRPLIQKLNGSKSEQFVIFKNQQVVATGTYLYRTKEGGVNRGKLQLDPAHVDLAPFMIQYILVEVQRVSPGRRLELELQNWQPALLEAAQLAGCKKRFSYAHMAMRFR